MTYFIGLITDVIGYLIPAGLLSAVEQRAVHSTELTDFHLMGKVPVWRGNHHMRRMGSLSRNPHPWA